MRFFLRIFFCHFSSKIAVDLRFSLAMCLKTHWNLNKLFLISRKIKNFKNINILIFFSDTILSTQTASTTWRWRSSIAVCGYSWEKVQTLSNSCQTETWLMVNGTTSSSNTIRSRWNFPSTVLQTPRHLPMEAQTTSSLATNSTSAAWIPTSKESARPTKASARKTPASKAASATFTSIRIWSASRRWRRLTAPQLGVSGSIRASKAPPAS